MLDYSSPFAFVFKDPRWWRKLLVASLLTCTLVGAAPVLGWTIEVVRRVALGVEPALPEFKDWGSYWKMGVRFAAVHTLWLLPLLLVTLALYILPALLIGNTADETVLLVFGETLMCVFGLLFLFGWVYMFFIQPMMVALAGGGTVWQSANPARLWRLARPRFMDYFIVFLVIWLAVINLLFLLSSFTLYLLLPAALVYGGLVTAHFTGQLGRGCIPADGTPAASPE